MYQYQQVNPYRRNCEALRAFFAKPITLVIAIASAAQVLLKFLNGISNSQISLDVTGTLISIAFFLLYFQSKSQKPEVSYKAPLTLIKVYAIIEIVVMSLGILALLLCLIILAGINSSDIRSYGDVFMESILSFVMPFLISAIPFFIICILFYSALLLLCGSFKKSLASIYLYKNGAVFLAVTAILLCVSSVIVTAVACFTLSDLLPKLLSELQYLEEAGVLSGIFSVSGASIPSTLIVTTLIGNVLSFVFFISLAVFAIKYNSYITMLVTTIGGNDNTNGAQFGNAAYNSANGNPYEQNASANPYGQNAPQHGTPYTQNANPYNGNPYDANPYGQSAAPQAAPVNFTPEPVFNNDTEIPMSEATEPAPQANNDTFSSNPFAAPSEETDPFASAPAAPAVKTCPACGNSCPMNAAFCGNCGTKL